MVRVRRKKRMMLKKQQRLLKKQRIVEMLTTFLRQGSFLYIVFILSLNSCDTLSGHVGVCDSIDESKTENVFVQEYTMISSPIINDSIKLSVKEAWVENIWQYHNRTEVLSIPGSYQLVIIFNEPLLDGYDNSWSIGNSFEQSLRPCSYDCIMTDIDSLSSGDTLTWAVVTGRILKTSKNRKIGEFKLMKK